MLRGTNPYRSWVFITVFVLWVSWSNYNGLQAQPSYLSTPGSTSVKGAFDPLNPQPKAPTVPLAAGTQPTLPTLPSNQYQGIKATIGQYSKSSFSSPPGVQVGGPFPKAPSPAAQASIVSAPTSSWQGIQIPVGNQFQPPSPDVATGPSDVLMVINSTIAQFTKSGTLKTQTNFQDWFSSVLGTVCPAGGCLIFDPWIVYDQLHGRFLFLATSRSGDFRTSYLLVSVSNGATYSSGWTIWALNAGLYGTTVTGLWADSWRLGFDNVAVYLTGNMYDTSSNFQYAKIRVVKKSDLYNPATTNLGFQDVGSAGAPLKNANGTLADSIVPVHQRGKPSAGNAALLISATTFNVPATFLSVWKIADPLATPLTVTLNTISGVWAYDFPAPAPQLNGSTTLDSGDSRMLKAIYRDGFIYTARDTGYTDQATTVTFDVIDTTQTPMALSSQARLVNTNSFYPSFDVPASTDPGSQFAIGNVVAGTTTAADGTLTYASISKLKAGQGPFAEGPSPNRWGDYFGGAVDPVTGGLWVSGEYAQPPSSGFGVWGTWVGYFPWLTTNVFSDVPAPSLFSDYINILQLWQVTQGCSTGLFCPTDTVTRGQVAAFMIRAMFGETFTYTTVPYFTDVPASNLFFKYVQKLRDLGITHGCTTSTYCPNDPINRGDAAVFVIRGKLSALFGDQFTYPTTPDFTDVPAGSVDFPFIQKMYELGITSGCDTTNYCPASPLLREQMAVFITRAFLN
jgi:hypothetical protein